MDTKIIRLLNQINTDFYATTAIDFDDSRQYFWEGWSKIPPLLDKQESVRIADIGCGNGRFGEFLLKKTSHITLSYTGIDNNKLLLEFANKSLKGKIPALHLRHIDIIEQLLSDSDFLENQSFQLIVSFGVLHHIPSYKLRLKLIQHLLSKLAPGGVLVLSLWQFMEYQRFQNKVADTNTLESLNISASDLEHNDFILDWQRGSTAYRYCHYIDSSEQEQLVKDANAHVLQSFRADGKEGNVNQYLFLQKTA